MEDTHNQQVDFTQQILTRLQENISDIQFTITRPLTIQITYFEQEIGVISLDSLYIQFQNKNSSFELALEEFLTSIKENIQMIANSDMPSRNTIFPTLKHISYRDVLIEQMKEIGKWDGDVNKLPLISKALTESLIIRYVIDQNNSFRNLSLSDLPDYQLNSIEELHELAIDNLAQFYTDNELKFEQLDEGIYQFNGGQNFEASLILLDSLWQNFPTNIKGEIIVFIPAADVIYIVDSHYHEAVKNVMEAVKSITQEVPHPIIDEGIVYRNGRWEQFKIEKPSILKRLFGNFKK